MIHAQPLLQQNIRRNDKPRKRKLRHRKNVNKDGNNDENAASGSGSDDPIFDPIAMSWYHLGITEEDQATIATALRPRHHMYLLVVIYLPYKYPIHAILNMFHKLLYAKIGVLYLCC